MMSSEHPESILAAIDAFHDHDLDRCLSCCPQRCHEATPPYPNTPSLDSRSIT